MSNAPPKFLTEKQVEIMIKYYYMKSLKKVAAEENITVNQVKGHLSNGFRIMRLAYSPRFQKGLYFDAPAVLRHMADSAGLTYQELLSHKQDDR